MTEPDTFYLPSEQDSDDAVFADMTHLKNSENLYMLINAMPCPVAILNDKRQIVFCNQNLLELLKFDQLEAIISVRPEEAFKCERTKDGLACGTTEFCRYCGAAQAIKDCMAANDTVSKECRLTCDVFPSGSVELTTTAAPFSSNGKNYVIFSVEDVSAVKRRDILENTFLHDLINSVGCVDSYISLIKRMKGDEEVELFLDRAKKASRQVLEEIKFQRQLRSAEDGTLAIANNTLN